MVGYEYTISVARGFQTLLETSILFEAFWLLNCKYIPAQSTYLFVFLSISMSRCHPRCLLVWVLATVKKKKLDIFSCCSTWANQRPTERQRNKQTDGVVFYYQLSGHTFKQNIYIYYCISAFTSIINTGRLCSALLSLSVPHTFNDYIYSLTSTLSLTTT